MSGNSSKNVFRLAFVLLLLFILIIIVGHFFLAGNGNVGTSVKALYKIASSTPSSSAPAVGQNNPSESSKNPAVCAEALKTDTRNQGVQYEQGTVLVSFASSVDFQTAESVLRNYGAGVQSPASAESFSSNHLLTATVPPGQEFMAVCSLRQDPKVHYANLNVYFNLHE